MICDVCQSLLENHDGLTAAGTVPHHLTYHSLLSSVERGCYICNKVWSTLSQDERTLILESTNETAFLKTASSRNPAKTSVTTLRSMEFDQVPDTRQYLMQIDFIAGTTLSPKDSRGRPAPAGHHNAFLLQPQDDALIDNITRVSASTTKSAEVLALAKRWLADCSQGHEECIAAPEKHRYPTRLVDCGLSEDPNASCRLIETNATKVSGPYMTLSHCWGIVDCLKLTTDNYARLCNGIPFSILPQLYQDAVYVTRYLKVRYLWIDSLCIIQQGDNVVDWQREVSLMQQVFSNTFCNISAADALNSSQSMFCSRNPNSFHPETVSLQIDGRDTPYLVTNFLLWDAEVSRAPVNRRGWVLQERLLAPRVLYFGARQVFWECNKTDASEMYPKGVPSDMSSLTGHFKNFTSICLKEDTTESSLAPYLIWFDIVRTFTSCRLTFPADKLAALSAIARKMGTVLCDEYVAGMWRRYLEHELLWSVDKALSDTNSMRSFAYRAPSWSWAAADGAVEPGLLNVDDAKVFIKVEDLHLDYLTDDSMGLLRGGWLQLQGTLKQVVFLPCFQPGAFPGGEWDMVVNGVHIGIHPEVAIDIKLDMPGQNLNNQDTCANFYCMPARITEGKYGTIYGTIYALLLELCDEKRCIFRRIGLARGWGEDVKGKILASSEGEEHFPCKEYRDGRHSIIII